MKRRQLMSSGHELYRKKKTLKLCVASAQLIIWFNVSHVLGSVGKKNKFAYASYKTECKTLITSYLKSMF